MTDDRRNDEDRLERAKNRFEREDLEDRIKAKGRTLDVEQDTSKLGGGGTPPKEEPPKEEPPKEEPPNDVPINDPVAETPLLRTQRIAFAITGVWEGSAGYANYQTYDAGIISYGKHQVTLASGNLGVVVTEYLKNADPGSPHSKTLRNYASRISARDATLRDDQTLKAALVGAAAEQAMRDAQDKTIIDGFWGPAQRSAGYREIIRPLSHAFMFDAAIQHGPYHSYMTDTEDELGIPNRVPLSQSGVTEDTLLIKTAERRLSAMKAFAARTGLNGVIPRAQFWVDMMKAGDWYLKGDAKGIIYVKTRPVDTNP